MLGFQQIFRTAVFVVCATVATGVTTSLGGCGGTASGGKDKGPADAQVMAADAAVSIPFEADPARVYVAKVKNVLVGLAPTQQEVDAVQKDPKQLGGLIDGWMKLPAYKTKLQTFFQLAFQQTQVAINDFADQTYPRQAVVNAYTRTLLASNAQESFARTVLQLIAEGKPFSEVVTTQRFMMTPALMEFYAYLDLWQVGDSGKVMDRFRQLVPITTQITVSAAQGPIPLTETLDPKSPNYMHWYDPDLASPQGKLGMGPAACSTDPIVYPARSDALHFLLYGSLIGRQDAQGNKCQQYGGTAGAPQLTAADFSDWKMVTIRPPTGSEKRTAFYDLTALRSGNELVLTTPRVGFFSTPAFFANWQTNDSNQMRVTINQTLIVALGAAVDGTDNTSPSSTPGIDAAHTQSGDCFSCHQTLDPTRSVLTATYSWNYHDQDDPKFLAQKGMFAFQGVQKPVANIADLGGVLAAHPLFASAWAQKLCYYVNSQRCDTGDPEFKRVVSLFQSSNYSWNTLVRELLSSPLITHQSSTQTAQMHGVTVAVSRRDHFCAALNERLGLVDVCGINAGPKAQRAVIPEVAAGLPSDGYGRGGVAPVLPNDPTLFYRAGIENICETIAGKVIDVPAAMKTAKQTSWSSGAPEQAVSDFVAVIMALTPSDPRASAAHDLLLSHFKAAMQKGATATNALRSTFTVACLAPSSLSIGL